MDSQYLNNTINGKKWNNNSKMRLTIVCRFFNDFLVMAVNSKINKQIRQIILFITKCILNNTIFPKPSIQKSNSRLPGEAFSNFVPKTINKVIRNKAIQIMDINVFIFFNWVGDTFADLDINNL